MKRNKSNWLYIILTLAGLIGCSSNKFDSDFFERVSSIKLPDRYNVIDFSECEWAAVAVIDIPLDECSNFIKTYHFDSVPEKYKVSFMGMDLIKKENRNFPLENNRLVLIESCKTGYTWYYLLDKQTGRLWCEIQFPDLGGTAPKCNDTLK